MILFLFAQSTPVVSALSTAQQKLFKSGVLLFDADTCGDSSSTDSSTSDGSSNSVASSTGVQFDTGMTVDDDGIGPSHGDLNHQGQTSYANGTLNADNTSYIALAPGWAANHGLVLGDIAAVQYNGKTAYAVYGDNYMGDQVHGEGSVHLVEALGGNATSSLADSGVHYTVYPGTHTQLAGSVDQSKIDQIGQQASGGPSSTGGNATSNCGGCTGGATTLTGNSNQEKAFNFFVQMGLSQAQAAGVVANLQNESSINPLVSGSNPNVAVFGIAQWTPGSKYAADKLLNHISGSDSYLLVQLQVLWEEMNGKSSQGFTNIIQTLKQISDPGRAAEYFRDSFEACDISYASCSDRGSVGIDMFKKLANSSISGASDTSCVGSPDCQNATGTTKILCEAKQYEGIYYEYGGGHQGYDKFKQSCPDPSNPPNNQASGGPANGDPAGKGGNPSPCGLDCSGLVSIAVDDAFNQKYIWSIDGGSMQGAGSEFWKKIDIASAQAGDIVTTSEHVEIVDHVQGSTVYTFGAHDTGLKIGGINTSTNYWTGAWHWTGPGSS
ncbi:MAG: phage tail tip lysozyme [Candidatus Saccharimonadales bacterium]